MTGPADLFAIFERHARASSGRTLARVCGGGPVLTAGALLDHAATTARHLRNAGLRGGDLAVVAGASGTALVQAMLAVWSCDAVAIAADPQIAAPELEELERTFSPRLVIRLSEPGALAIGPARTGGARHGGDARHSGGARFGTPAAGGDLLALPASAAVIKLTSGSTGRPRGIAVTGGQLLADAHHLIEGMRIGPDDVNIASIPMSHSYGMDSLLMPLVIQGTALLIVPAPLPDLLTEALSIDQPAIFPGVPYLFEILSRPDGPPVRVRGLKTCLSAGAPLRARTAAAFAGRLGLPVRSFYGTSETGGITYDASESGDAAAAGDGCVGTPLPGVDVVLEGEEGRVVVRGRNVTSGYVGPVEDGDDSGFGDGVFRTGDTGRFDEHGRLHLTGRIAGLINISWRKVNPREIERTLLAVDGVGDAAVLSVSDESRGESLVACVVRGSDDGVTREQVMTHLRRSLAPYKLPRRILFLSALPRTVRGKLDAEALRREALSASDE